MPNALVDTVSTVQRCHDQVVGFVNQVSDFNGQVYACYSVEELRDLLQGGKPPAAGVLYNGLHGGNKQTGLASSASFTILALLNSERFGATTPAQGFTNREYGIRLMATVRRSLKTVRSPSGHFWQFSAEGPAAEKKGLVVWFQTWIVPVILQD